MRRILEQSYYELLEVPRSASPEEIERAGQRARVLYGAGSLAAYALLSAPEADALAGRVEDALSVLLDPDARAAYDARVPVGDAAVRPQPDSPPVVVAPPPPPAQPAPAAEPVRPFVLPEGAVWTGALLREAREARGLSLTQLAERTKLARAHIELVEAERFDQLPVPVYLRGIVMCLARELRLDGQKVARSYLERAAASRAGRSGPAA